MQYKPRFSQRSAHRNHRQLSILQSSDHHALKHTEYSRVSSDSAHQTNNEVHDEQHRGTTSNSPTTHRTPQRRPSLLSKNFNPSTTTSSKSFKNCITFIPPSLSSE